MPVDEEDFYRSGCRMTGHNWNTRSRIVGTRRFKAFFGATPLVCVIIWRLLDRGNHHPRGGCPYYMLCALLFLKQYNTEEVNRGLTGLDEKTIRKWQWIYVALIAFNIHVVSFANI